MNHIKTKARLKLDPSLVDYLIKKGNYEDEIESYIGLTVEYLVEYTYHEGGQL